MSCANTKSPEVIVNNFNDEDMYEVSKNGIHYWCMSDAVLDNVIDVKVNELDLNNIVQ